MLQISLIYVTFPSEESVFDVSQKLLKDKAVACINILGPIQSLYMWKGELQNTKEIAVLFKTTKENVPFVIETLSQHHPYDVPSILEIPISHGFEPFIHWIKESVTPA